MDKEYLKNVEAPNKRSGASLKQRGINTYIFTAVSSIVNLAFMIVLAFGLIFFLSWFLHIINQQITEEEFAKFVQPIMWASVIISIVFSLWLQKFVIRLTIKIFKWEDKFEESFVEKYCGKKQ